jgi:predicted short-subunit dehydrogenase-like oxidoreductase (DUF2520 family)
LASLHKRYGVMAAGAVSQSLIGRLQGRARELGPISAVSYRVASRIANLLRAGYPVRSTAELNIAAAVLFHAPPAQMEALIETLQTAEIQWTGKALIFCDYDVPQSVRQHFDRKGASTAIVWQIGIPGLLAVDGSGLALAAVNRIMLESKMKALQISAESREAFEAAMTLGSAALTPLVDYAARLLRQAGIRDIEAARVASALFEQTVRDYTRSGKQSWAWYLRKPDVLRLEAGIHAAGPQLEPLFRHLLLFGLNTFDKHPDVAAGLDLNTNDLNTTGLNKAASK